ncbi:hypothetical protein QYM36_018713, partial [Artemia franciscana]
AIQNVSNRLVVSKKQASNGSPTFVFGLLDTDNQVTSFGSVSAKRCTIPVTIATLIDFIFKPLVQEIAWEAYNFENEKSFGPGEKTPSYIAGHDLLMLLISLSSNLK